MRDLLQLVFEYRRLLAKVKIKTDLRPKARGRLDALEKLFGEEPSEDPAHEASGRARRRHARCSISVPATVRVNGTLQPVNLVNVGGGGICISPAPNMQVGDTAFLRIHAEEDGCVYQYQVQASWMTQTQNSTIMGMPFIGTPRELELE